MQAPELNSAEQAQTRHTAELIRQHIEAAGGRIPFDRFMELALYAPGAGYYVNGAHKFGAGGDFVTAPEISPLFGRCLGNQCAQVLHMLGGGEVLEFGAGSGAMAAHLLQQLHDLDCLPQHYLILELSPELQARQRETLAARVPQLLPRVRWLKRLPSPGWQGVVVANEVLDAMPVQRFRAAGDAIQEQFVTFRGEGFATHWDDPASAQLAPALQRLQQRLGEFAPGYSSEINLRLPGWMRALADMLGRGAALLVDYGYSEREYYHPQRSEGTLICHLRHRAHDDPLLLPGLQDITANVDFSAVAEAALEVGLELAGYTTQAHFLIDLGLQAMLAEVDANDMDAYLPRLQQVKQLTLPSGMGERFKALGLTRGLEQPLAGFIRGDMRAYL